MAYSKAMLQENKNEIIMHLLLSDNSEHGTSDRFYDMYTHFD
jgi:hypothetical protein